MFSATICPATTRSTPNSVCIVGRSCPATGLPYNIAGGRITDIDSVTGAITYELTVPNFFGPVTFQYTVADTTGARSSAATVSIQVGAVNDTPNAVPDNAFTTSGNRVFVPVLLDNGWGPDTGIGDVPLRITIEIDVSDPAEGTCEVVPITSTSVRFTPGPGFAGSTTCSYRVTDSDLPVGEWSVAVITIYVNDPPVAEDDTAVTDENTDVVIDVLKLSLPGEPQQGFGLRPGA